MSVSLAAVVLGVVLTVFTARIIVFAYSVELKSQSWGARYVGVAGVPDTWVVHRTTGTIGITYIFAQRLPPGTSWFGGVAPLPRWSALTLDETTRDCREVTEIAVGWPFRAFATRRTDPQEFAETLATFESGGTSLYPSPFGRLVPLDPRTKTEMIPLGFAANIIVWGLFSAFVWCCGLFALSRTGWARARKGLCMRCAYPLPMGTGEVRCPECGKLQAAPRCQTHESSGGKR